MLWLLLTGCGDNSRPCSYVERDDGDNDVTAEATGIAIGGGAQDVCGAIDGGHAANGTLDVDRFRVSIAGSDMLFQLAADDEAAVLPSGLELRVFDTAPVPTLLADLSLDVKQTDHAAMLVELPAGDYDIVMSAAAAGDLSGTIGYRLRVTEFDFSGCTVAGTATYAEADDTGNAAVAIDYAKTPQFTAMGGSPELTKLSVEAGHDYKITGSAGTDATGDDYLDRDTYAVATDETTNEMTIRLAWTDPVDLDYALFEDGSLEPTAISNTASTTVQELQTFAVKPSTRYWLWVGRHVDATGTATSGTAAYDATVCPAHFFH